ncbi:hypothetical protein SBA1_460007 [Candidatus Sulfotelmatobacter kueseliae]|uniref:Uncharacterized protein n=1 Tax=Candidatus Sulfotelmatobacter kueseliae TaxID=2042962 RepID=A0A2U3KS28_9BACT|nr:hypothetical protein SBA1_460007 [Candidatus Sulfotelmatobacter kueseliae]
MGGDFPLGHGDGDVPTSRKGRETWGIRHPANRSAGIFFGGSKVRIPTLSAKNADRMGHPLCSF